MEHNVNSNTFKKKQDKSKWKQNPWIPLVIIIVLALLLVAVNWIMLDFLQAAY